MTTPPPLIMSYDIARDGLADLALPLDLEQRLRDALDRPVGSILTEHIERDVNACLLHDGGWDGDWSPTLIVETILAGAAALGWLA